MDIKWECVMPAMTTAFTDDDQLDLKMLGLNLSAQVEAGVTAVILGGTLGEASTLRENERSALLDFTLETVSGRAGVICNIAEQSTKEAVRAALVAEQKGADGLMVLPPMRYKATDSEVVRYFSEIAAATTLPIMIYNNPVDYGIEVKLNMFEKLLQFDNIQAVKESTRDISNIQRIRNLFGERLRILCGVDTLALESLLMGANGWVAGLVCAFPKETVTIYKLVKEGRLAEAKEIYRWFMPLLELDISPQLVQNIKLASTYTGLGTEYVRPPRLPLSGKERERVTTLINERLGCRPALPDFAEIKAVEP
jgi:4-hydroxy-tetrahydrodipicolinate synthase